MWYDLCLDANDDLYDVLNVDVMDVSETDIIRNVSESVEFLTDLENELKEGGSIDDMLN